jgi:hypothetical protein
MWGVFLLGALTGAGLTWSTARAGERVRRIRYELRTARKGIKTLRKMLRRETGSLVKAGLVVALVLAALVAIGTMR